MRVNRLKNEECRLHERVCGAAIVAIVAAGVVTPALAQTTADELRRQIQVLEQRQKEQDALIGTLRQRLDQLDGAAKAAQEEAKKAAADAASRVTSGNERARLSISGHVNRGVLFAEDGESSKFFNVDNAHSASRFRLQGQARFNNDFSAGTNFEVQLRLGRSNRVEFDANTSGDSTFDPRVIEVYFNSESLGRLSMGRGSSATDGSSEVDLSGTTLINKSQISDFAGGIRFYNETNRVRAGQPRVFEAIDNLDGLSRTNRVRYDTPTIAGFQGSASFSNLGGNLDAFDGALRYGATIAGTRFAAAVGYASTDDVGGDIASGSASVLFPVGISLTSAVAKQTQEGRNNPTFYYGKVGYQFRTFEFGRTALSVDYGRGKHFRISDERLEAYGVGAVQNIDSIGTEVFFGYRHHRLKSPGVDYSSIDAVMSGARVRF